MTDEAQVAPAAPSAAVIDAPTQHTPELGSQTPIAEKPAPSQAEAKPEPKVAEKPAPSKSADEAVKRANEAVKARAEAQAKEKTAEKPAPKVDPKTEVEARTRSEDGKFVPKESPGDKPSDGTVQAKTEGNQTSEGRKPHHEPPARFLENARKDWANAPESIQEEVHRTIKNLEEGHLKYKETAEKFEKVREFDDLARKNGREGIHESLREVVELENAFTQRGPIEGFKKVADHFGINLQAVAAHIMGQNPDQRVQEAHTRIRELESKIQHMELVAKAPDMVAEFAATHDRFEELSDVIATLLKTGTAKDLDGAYELAAVLKAPASSAGHQTASSARPEAAASPAQAEIPLNPAGQKSVSGAPAGGISPAAKRPAPKSNLDALRSAAARVG